MIELDILIEEIELSNMSRVSKKYIYENLLDIKQKLTEQLRIGGVSQQRELLEAFVKQIKEDNELTEEITFQDVNKCISSNCG